ncbi:hypothetical protein ACI8AA_06895 [Geodermatophilus sp. SYSU D01180]
MADITPERERAERARQRYFDTAARLRDDRDLTEHARQRRLADAWVTTRRELDALREEEHRRLAARERDLERRLFGLNSAGGDTASQAISARDAQDRAARITSPAEAAELLERAERNADSTLARAIAHHALQQSRASAFREQVQAWDAVLGSFLDARPHVAPVVEELAQIERLTGREVLSPYSLAQPSGIAPSVLNAASASQTVLA